MNKILLDEVVTVYRRIFAKIADDDRYLIQSRRVFPSPRFKSWPPFVEDMSDPNGYFLQVDATFQNQPWPEASKMIRLYFAEERLIWIGGVWRDEMLLFYINGGWRNLSGGSISRPYPQGLEFEDMAKEVNNFCWIQATPK